eukprot:TRINITY_DN56257_c0_g1_i1.p1 TRINITY_DN56257_c0_g1~~TRINITY_DN56257_c0_g1_i1.p1  ORF type:complete len:204 (+),score=51.82 TRINITY_DN56257_c0_g1_i1:161-772(+)
MAGYATVRLRGLQGAAHLNGLLALCKGFDEQKGRWLVELEGGDEKAVKNDNILTTVEPGSTLLLERGCVAHVTVSRASWLAEMEEEARESLEGDFAAFSERMDVRAEWNTVDGWPQLSVVLRGVPDAVQLALPELEALLRHYGQAISISGVGVTARRASPAGAADASATAAAGEAPDTVEVDGLVVESKERRPRAKPKNRYGC